MHPQEKGIAYVQVRVFFFWRSTTKVLSAFCWVLVWKNACVQNRKHVHVKVKSKSKGKDEIKL